MTDPSTPESGSRWTHVPRGDEPTARPRRAADPDPDEQDYLDLDATHPAEEQPRTSPADWFASLPRQVRIGLALGCTAVLVVIAALLGTWLASPGTDPSTPAESQGPWPMVAPAEVGDYHLDTPASGAPSPSTLDDDSKALLTATYSAGDKGVVLLLTRPENDPNQLMRDAAMQNTVVVHDAYCGTSTDTGRPACARVVDDTGVLLVGPAGLANDQLVPILDQFVEALQAG